MVYLRAKTVKGDRYLYLVKSVWDPTKGTSKQKLVKYLGKASDVTLNDIPVQHKNDPKIISFLSKSGTNLKKWGKLSKIFQSKLLQAFLEADFDEALTVYKKYKNYAGTEIFFDEILTPVMYKIGDLWAKNKISVADEHVSSNIVFNLVNTIMPQSKSSKKFRIVLCTPQGEEHCLGCKILEWYLSNKGCMVFNLAPSTPNISLLKFIAEKHPDIILISITIDDNIKPTQRLVKKIKEKFDIPIMVGGQAVYNKNIPFGNGSVREKILLEKIPKMLSQWVLERELRQEK
ncbi:MAG: histidine kinase [Thaumarchaeota archaeon]|nr:histidine kinase [Nitrososphaerota archaeon]